MGNKQAKKTSTELTDKRSLFSSIVRLMYVDICWYLSIVLDIALLKSNTKYSEHGSFDVDVGSIVSYLFILV
jgi:hypothetical protein